MPEKRKHSILLVDDEPEILYSLRGLLRREFDLHTAESAEEALEIMEQHPIHVVMTDQRMPEMSGVELVGRISTRYPEAIRMVFTGYADIKAVIEAINEGGLFRYITKPWDPDELIEVLHEAAAEYDAMVERRALLRDMRRHIEQCQQLAEDDGKREKDSSTVPVDVEQFIESGNELLARIEKALET